jgi:hypothetical protein
VEFSPLLDKKTQKGTLFLKNPLSPNASFCQYEQINRRRLPQGPAR